VDLAIFDAVGPALGAGGDVALAGAWRLHEVGGAEHHIWEATLGEVLAGVLFLRHSPAEPWAWAKSAPPAPGPVLSITLSRWASERRCTFGAAFHRAARPAEALTLVAEPAASCRFAPSLRIGRADVVARCAGAEVALLVLPPEPLRVGRSRLWRVRDELAGALPEEARAVLTRGRTGILLDAPAFARPPA
jgi:hypothetical protein